jgi:hypothetical protein
MRILPKTLLSALLLTCSIATAQTADESFSMESYRSLGVPAADKVWGNKEYEKAVEVLLQEPARAMPRFGSPRSGAMFARIISTENLLPAGGYQTIVDRGPEATQEAFLRLSAYMAPLTTLRDRYMEKGGGKQPYGTEVIRLSYFMIQSARALVDMTEGFISTLPEQKRTAQSTVDSKNRLREGLRVLIVRGLEMLAQEDAYDDADLEFLAEGLRQDIPAVAGLFNAAQVKAIRLQIATLSDKHRSRKVRASLQRLTDQMESD